MIRHDEARLDINNAPGRAINVEHEFQLQSGRAVGVITLRCSAEKGTQKAFKWAGSVTVIRRDQPTFSNLGKRWKKKLHGQRVEQHVNVETARKHNR